MGIAEMLWAQMSSTPDRVALKAPGRAWTYDQLRSAADALRHRLAQAGARRGDHVVLIAPSVPEFAAAYYGALASGLVVTTLNTMATSAEIEHVLRDAEVRFVMAWRDDASSARRAAERCEAHLILLDKQSPSVDAGRLVPVDCNEEDVAVVLYTSGTTGRPKGAQLTHRNIRTCSDDFHAGLQVRDDDRFATALPLFHIYGQVVVMNTALQAGCSVSLRTPFDAATMLEVLCVDEITVACGVPTMWNAMLHEYAAMSPGAFRHLRLATSGGAAMPSEVVRAFEQRFGCVILEGYGLTESAGSGTFHDLSGTPARHTVGRALPSVQIEVRDASGDEVPADVVGEIFLRGASVMKGYLNRPEANAADLVDGWLRTGDLGAVDGEGNLRIVDRTKDLIIRGGYNVYPREVEEVMYEHPDILEVAIVGVPDDHYGEEVAAVVALVPGAEVGPDRLRAWAKEQLSAYKVPRIFQFVEALPKGPTGKVLKRSIDRDGLRRAGVGCPVHSEPVGIESGDHCVAAGEQGQ
ncbi:AMP-binding protein [Aeromicrobium sp. CTD01-1L150]|uniref:AMP-binding protein n=1 Tax=Aeromicrobium sp. CTD01-1L150 TaxID=3341830 RepID=UPI0035BF74B9